MWWGKTVISSSEKPSVLRESSTISFHEHLGTFYHGKFSTVSDFVFKEKEEFQLKTLPKCRETMASPDPVVPTSVVLEIGLGSDSASRAEMDTEPSQEVQQG